MNSGAGAIRMGVAGALLFASLSLVVWRQGRALDALRGLDAARSERAQLQAERAQLNREIAQLESRSRITEFAALELGLHMPSDAEIKILSPRHAGVESGDRLAGRSMLSAAER